MEKWPLKWGERQTVNGIDYSAHFKPRTPGFRSTLSGFLRLTNVQGTWFMGSGKPRLETLSTTLSWPAHDDRGKRDRSPVRVLGRSCTGERPGKTDNAVGGKPTRGRPRWWKMESG